MKRNLSYLFIHQQIDVALTSGFNFPMSYKSGFKFLINFLTLNAVEIVEVSVLTLTT